LFISLLVYQIILGFFPCIDHIKFPIFDFSPFEVVLFFNFQLLILC
jgi:hypothetical protein